MKHEKFKKVTWDNRKKIFHLEYASGLKIECSYFALGIREKVVDAGLDPETGHHAFYFVLENGTRDYVPFDQPLHIVQNPDYVKQQTLYQMTKQLNEVIQQEKISKRELARRLKTSLSQLSRILDPTNYKKDMSRLVEMSAILNYEFQWNFKKTG